MSRERVRIAPERPQIEHSEIWPRGQISLCSIWPLLRAKYEWGRLNIILLAGSVDSRNRAIQHYLVPSLLARQGQKSGLLAIKKPAFGQKPVTLVPGNTGIPGITGNTGNTGNTRICNPAWKPNRISLFLPEWQKGRIPGIPVVFPCIPVYSRRRPVGPE